MNLLQIYQWVCQWKNFENRLIFGEVMGKSLVSCFFETQCTVATQQFKVLGIVFVAVFVNERIAGADVSYRGMYKHISSLCVHCMRLMWLLACAGCLYTLTTKTGFYIVRYFAGVSFSVGFVSRKDGHGFILEARDSTQKFCSQPNLPKSLGYLIQPTHRRHATIKLSIGCRRWTRATASYRRVTRGGRSMW